MIQGVKSTSWIKFNSFDIHKIVLKTPYTKDSKLKILFSDLSDANYPHYENPQFICGLKVDDEIYLFQDENYLYRDDNDNENENDNKESVKYPYEEIELNKIDDDHFN